MLKRKREEMNKNREKEEEVFKRSSIMDRSPDRKREIMGEDLEK